MKAMKIAFVLCFGAGLLATTGCGKSKALEAAEEYQQAACACKDAACATAASQKFAARAADMASASSSEAEAITKATSAATECVTKAAMSGVPGMPGAAPKK
jgi:hypothetical protein